MNRAYKVIALSCAAAVAATLVFAQATTEELVAAVEARQTHMKERGAAIGVLAKMAQGELPYDATAAVVAATALVTLSSADQSTFWLPGSENGAVPDSFAKPALFENMDDYAAKTTALNVAAVAMQTAAAVDLAALQAALPALGGACGSCHETYRVPEN